MAGGIANGASGERKLPAFAPHGEELEDGPAELGPTGVIEGIRADAASFRRVMLKLGGTVRWEELPLPLRFLFGPDCDEGDAWRDRLRGVADVLVP